MTSSLPSILVVDDEPGIREMLSFELSLDGFEVETAASGFAAVEALRRRRFDVAITDLKMPGMDGAATLESLRALDPGIEVIVATGYASVETAVDCMRRGAYDYIIKPYDLGQLKLLLQRAMQKSHLQGMVALYDASRALLATLNHREMVELILSLARGALRGDDAGLILGCGENSEELSVYCHEASATTPSAALLLELARAALESGEARLVPSPEVAIPGAVGDGAAHVSALVYPLVARDQTRGALAVLRRAGSPGFSRSELERGSVLSGQVALALDNARLHDELARKVSELVRTRERLVLAEKMSLAGRLAGSMAHEVNNPLAVVESNLEGIREYAPTIQRLWHASRSAAAFLATCHDDAARAQATTLRSAADDATTGHVIREIAAMVDETSEAVRRIAQLVVGFTRLAGPAVTPGPEPEPVDLNELMRQCWATGGQAAANLHLGQGPCAALADRGDLATALGDLIAFLHAPVRADRSRCGAVTARVEMQDSRPAIVLSGVAGAFLSEAERNRLFEPQVDLDESGRTLRLNLDRALTYQLLHRNGAEISTSTEGGACLTVTILLPAA